MKNSSKIKGEGNVVSQNIENKSNKQKHIITGLIIAILTLLATIIIGWDNIQIFFSK